MPFRPVRPSDTMPDETLLLVPREEAPVAGRRRRLRYDRALVAAELRALGRAPGRLDAARSEGGRRATPHGSPG